MENNENKKIFNEELLNVNGGDCKFAVHAYNEDDTKYDAEYNGIHVGDKIRVLKDQGVIIKKGSIWVVKGRRHHKGRYDSHGYAEPTLIFDNVYHFAIPVTNVEKV